MSRRWLQADLEGCLCWAYAQVAHQETDPIDGGVPEWNGSLPGAQRPYQWHACRLVQGKVQTEFRLLQSGVSFGRLSYILPSFSIYHFQTQIKFTNAFNIYKIESSSSAERSGNTTTQSACTKNVRKQLTSISSCNRNLLLVKLIMLLRDRNWSMIKLATSCFQLSACTLASCEICARRNDGACFSNSCLHAVCMPADRYFSVLFPSYRSWLLVIFEIYLYFLSRRYFGTWFVELARCWEANWI